MCPMHVHLYAGGELLNSRLNLTVWIKATERIMGQQQSALLTSVCVCVLQVSFGCQLCLRCYTSCCWSLASVWCAWSFFTPVTWSMDSNWTPSPQSSLCCQVSLHPCPHLTLRETNCALLHYIYHPYKDAQPFRSHQSQMMVKKFWACIIHKVLFVISAEPQQSFRIGYWFGNSAERSFKLYQRNKILLL